MPDNVQISAGSGPPIRADDVGGGVLIQHVKLDIGPEGLEIPLVGDAINGIPVDVTRVQGQVAVDTELPTATGLADGIQNPITSIIGSFNYLWDVTGSQWNRWRGTEATGALVEISQIDSTVVVDTELPPATVLSDATPNPTAPASAEFGMVYNGASWDRKHAVGGASDGTTVGIEASGKYSYNGSTWDRSYNNTQSTLLNGAFTNTQSSTQQTNYNAKGAVFYLAIGSMPASGDTLTFVVEMLDPVGGTSIVQLTNFAATAPGNTTGAPLAYAFIVYPGASATGLPPLNLGVSTNVVYAQSIPLPRNWRARVIHSGTSTWDYTLGVSYIL